jgi:hypothetical protein
MAMFPPLAVLAVPLLVYLFRDEVQARYAVQPLLGLTRDEREPIVRMRLLLCVLPAMFIWLVWLIAIPDVNRQQVRNKEETAASDLRRLAAAETRAAAVNGGLYVPLGCLVEPRSCLPSTYTGPAFVASDVAQSPRADYRREFHGVDAAGADGRSGVAAGSLERFAIVASPLGAYITGPRSFCIDDTGVLCQTYGGLRPTVVEGRCAQCQPVY